VYAHVTIKYCMKCMHMSLYVLYEVYAHVTTIQ